MENELKHAKLSNYEFSVQFENCTLSPKAFTHEAHLRLVWIHIDKYGLEQANENVQNQLRRFAEHVGAKDKYHKTVSIAAVKVVNSFMRKSKSNSFEDFIMEFPRLLENFKELIESHYSFDIFNSVKAKNEYLEPDVSPFT